MSVTDLSKFITLKIEQLVKAQWNYKTDNPELAGKLAENIKRNGQIENILVRQIQDGFYEVVNGNHRYDALNLIGAPEVIAYDLGPISQQHAMRIAIETNETRFESDQDKLQKILRELAGTFTMEDLVATMPYRPEQFAALFKAPVVLAAADDNFPEQPKRETFVRRGDLFELGLHRLLCGDAASSLDLKNLMLCERCDRQPKLALHDPPYGISVVESGLGDGAMHGNAAAARGTFEPIIGDNKPFNPAHLLGLGEVVILWGANHYADKLPPSAAWIVWDKRDTLPSNGFSDCELAWVSKGNSARILRHMWNGMIRASERGEKRVHPTQKPVVLQGEIITKYSLDGDLVIDFYLGSGTTLIACEQLHRVCYGMELSPAYCEVIVRRWCEYRRTKNLDSTCTLNGRPLPDVVMERGAQI